MMPLAPPYGPAYQPTQVNSLVQHWGHGEGNGANWYFNANGWTRDTGTYQNLDTRYIELKPNLPRWHKSTSKSGDISARRTVFTKTNYDGLLTVASEDILRSKGVHHFACRYI